MILLILNGSSLSSPVLACIIFDASPVGLSDCLKGIIAHYNGKCENVNTLSSPKRKRARIIFHPQPNAIGHLENDNNGCIWESSRCCVKSVSHMQV